MVGNTDPLQLLLIAAVIFISGYAIYMNIRLARRNNFIRNIMKQITGEEREFSEHEIILLLSDIQKLNYKASYLESKILEDKTLSFILENEADMKIYLHYTREEINAGNIIAEGFKYVDSFYKTAFPVSNDRLDLLTKHNDKKFYGDFVIVICISNKIVNKYSTALADAGIKNYSFENILTETPPEKNENSDQLFLLSNHFIKGYINHKTGEIVANAAFNPEYSSPGFSKNIDNLIHP